MLSGTILTGHLLSGTARNGAPRGAARLPSPGAASPTGEYRRFLTLVTLLPTLIKEPLAAQHRRLLLGQRSANGVWNGAA